MILRCHTHTCPDLSGLCLYILVEESNELSASVVRETWGSTWWSFNSNSDCLDGSEHVVTLTTFMKLLCEHASLGFSFFKLWEDQSSSYTVLDVCRCHMLTQPPSPWLQGAPWLNNMYACDLCACVCVFPKCLLLIVCAAWQCYRITLVESDADTSDGRTLRFKRNLLRTDFWNNKYNNLIVFSQISPTDVGITDLKSKFKPKCFRLLE